MGIPAREIAVVQGCRSCRFGLSDPNFQPVVQGLTEDSCGVKAQFVGWTFMSDHHATDMNVHRTQNPGFDGALASIAHEVGRTEADAVAGTAQTTF